MKYIRLSKDQFEELANEFSTFLAAQGIDASQWIDIKTHHKDKVDQWLDLFSDMVWEESLKKVNYIEHWSESQLFLFEFHFEEVHLIVIKTLNNKHKLTTTSGINWLLKNILSDEVEFFESKKIVNEEQNHSKFKIIQQGGIITEGNWYRNFKNIIHPYS